MELPLAKVPFLLVTLYYANKILIPPATSQKQERVKTKWYDSYIIPSVCPWILRAIASIACLAEIITILAINYPSTASAQVLSLLSRNGQYPTLTLTNQILTGAILAAVFGHLRVECFRTLGRNFTFELSLRQGHKLITSGPYSIVRHPSYTTGSVALCGVSLVLVSPGSWLRSCGWLSVWQGRLWFGVWAISLAYGVFVAAKRTYEEDGFLKRHFGEEWEVYARRVRYKLIPCVW